VAIAQNVDGSFGEKNFPKDQKKVDDITKDIADHPLTDTSSSRACAKRAEDKEKLEIWKRNAKAFAMITLTMPSKLYHVLAASNGLAHVAMQQLYHEYKLDDHMSRVEAEHKYSSIRLNDNGNPRYLSQRFAKIAHQHPNAAADEPKKIAIILSAAPAMYQSILAAQQLALGAQCTSEHLIQAMEVADAALTKLVFMMMMDGVFFVEAKRGASLGLLSSSVNSNQGHSDKCPKHDICISLFSDRAGKDNS
jgi:gag-polypeptide of LTR copia-type